MSTTIRPIEKNDIPLIILLLAPYVREGIVLRRTPEEIEENLPFFFASFTNGKMSGIVSYHNYDNNLFEIRSLVVSQDFSGHGIGKALVNHIINMIREKHNSSRIFALTYVPDFFYRLGFERLDKAALPEKIWKDCINCPRKDSCQEIPVIYNKHGLYDQKQ